MSEGGFVYFCFLFKTQRGHLAKGLGCNQKNIFFFFFDWIAITDTCQLECRINRQTFQLVKWVWCSPKKTRSQPCGNILKKERSSEFTLSFQRDDEGCSHWLIKVTSAARRAVSFHREAFIAQAKRTRPWIRMFGLEISLYWKMSIVLRWELFPTPGICLTTAENVVP